MEKQLEFKFKEGERIKELKRNCKRNFLVLGAFTLINVGFLEGFALCYNHPEYISVAEEYIKSIFY